MQVKTILNRIQKQRGFVYGAVHLEEQISGLALTIAIAPHGRNRPRCSGCGRRGGVYDRLAPRRFEFVPLWGIPVFLIYSMRRVSCPTLRRSGRVGPLGRRQVESKTTNQLRVVPGDLGQAFELDRDEAQVFRTSWGDQVFRSVETRRGLGSPSHAELFRHSKRSGSTKSSGNSEQTYLTLVYQIDVSCAAADLGRRETDREDADRVFSTGWVTIESPGLRFVCSDMWKPYLNVDSMGRSSSITLLFSIVSTSSLT